MWTSFPRAATAQAPTDEQANDPEGLIPRLQAILDQGGTAATRITEGMAAG